MSLDANLDNSGENGNDDRNPEEAGDPHHDADVDRHPDDGIRPGELVVPTVTDREVEPVMIGTRITPLLVVRSLWRSGEIFVVIVQWQNNSDRITSDYYHLCTHFRLLIFLTLIYHISRHVHRIAIGSHACFM